MNYQLAKSPLDDASGIMLLCNDGTILGIPPDPANTDYAAYLEWVEAGNTPEPAPAPEPVPALTTEQKLEAAGLTVTELKELFGLT